MPTARSACRLPSNGSRARGCYEPLPPPDRRAWTSHIDGTDGPPTTATESYAAAIRGAVADGGSAIRETLTTLADHAGRMLVRDLMTGDVVTIDREATLSEAARVMLESHTGSVVVTAEGTPTGIVTETDALAVGCVADATFDEIPVADVMSHPLETIEPDVTVRAAVERMAEADVKKLPVMDGMALRGILTMSDVVGSYHDIVREAHELDERREGWESARLTSGDISELTRREQ